MAPKITSLYLWYRETCYLTGQNRNKYQYSRRADTRSIVSSRAVTAEGSTGCPGADRMSAEPTGHCKARMQNAKR